jgi:hypothetical protein
MPSAPRTGGRSHRACGDGPAGALETIGTISVSHRTAGSTACGELFAPARRRQAALNVELFSASEGAKRWRLRRILRGRGGVPFDGMAIALHCRNVRACSNCARRADIRSTERGSRRPSPAGRASSRCSPARRAPVRPPLRGISLGQVPRADDGARFGESFPASRTGGRRPAERRCTGAAGR